ncbi:MAG TPA: PQ-loop repeat-containing protein [Chthonomonadaceae bacterium]|jgi:lipid-A-disaccharide synthase-like uncharacterized protein|nr:PQ-loop repeat-containing protein [Chthonomonadaceae bacterium]
MDPRLLEWIGTLGFWLIEASYIAQILKLYRMKEAEEFNLLFPGLNLLGRILAVIYAISQGKGVFVFGFTLGIVLRCVLLGQVALYRYRRRVRLRLQEEAVSI